MKVQIQESSQTCIISKLQAHIYLAIIFYQIETLAEKVLRHVKYHMLSLSSKPAYMPQPIFISVLLIEGDYQLSRRYECSQMMKEWGMRGECPSPLYL